MTDKDPYAAYITAVAGLESTLSNAQADVSRAKREIQQKSISAEKRETGKLTSFDSTVQGFEKGYAAVADMLSKSVNAPLGVNIPKQVRPAATRQNPQTLVMEQKRIIASITADVNEFQKMQAQESAKQKAQAALRAREAKRAAEALAARRAALSQKPAQPEPAPPAKRKPPYKAIAIAGVVTLVILVVALTIIL